ncbi:MAG: type II secretion system protein GspM [Alphaproteobacteria bacterium]
MSLGPAVQKLLAVALLAAVGFAAWAGGVVPIKENFDRFEATAAQSRDLIARYQSILAGAAALRAEIAAIRRNRVLKEGFLVAPSAELGAAILQVKVKQAAVAGEAKLISIQVLAAKKEAEFTRVGVRARLKGTVAALQTALFELETAWPALVVDNINVRARTRRLRRDRTAPTTMTVDANLSIHFDAHGFMVSKVAASPTSAKGNRK